MNHPVTTLRGSRSVEWLATESGVPPVTIARIEAGLTVRPHARVVARLAEALDVRFTALEESIAEWGQTRREAA